MSRDVVTDYYFVAMLLDLLEKLGIKQAAPKTLMEKFMRASIRPVSVGDTP